jgi:hypothetical protein
MLLCFSVNFLNFLCSVVHIPAVEKQDVTTPDGAFHSSVIFRRSPSGAISTLNAS